MVAIAFLGALRADAISSPRVEHVRRSDGLIVQDASPSRTKNGKSLRVKFFPLPAIFSKTVAAWKRELLERGYETDDALFPDEKQLMMRAISSARRAIPVMASTHAVAMAFKISSYRLGKSFSPHWARHCIGRRGGKSARRPDNTRPDP